MDLSLLPTREVDADGTDPCARSIDDVLGALAAGEANAEPHQALYLDSDCMDTPAPWELPPQSPHHHPNLSSPPPALLAPTAAEPAAANIATDVLLEHDIATILDTECTAQQTDVVPDAAVVATAIDPADANVADVMEAMLTDVDGANPSAAGEPAAAPKLNAAQILESLRAAIPPAMLATYAEPATVTSEDAAAAAQRSELFHAEHKRQQGIVRAKPDVKAVKALQEAHPDWPCWERRHGHPPGVLPGQMFSGRAELWMAGAHCQYFRGIDARGGAPAYAIVLAGEYEDDDDHGDFLYYTGEGGRAEGGQAQEKDQSFASPGNAALKKAFEEGTPVRVMRGAKSIGEDGAVKLSYTYDGLYCVASAELETGRSGKLVCRFAMVGLPGHYKASRRVTFLSVRGFRSVVLAGREPVARRGRGGAKKRCRGGKRAAAGSSDDEEGESTDKWMGPGPQNREDYLFELRLRAEEGLVAEDVSGGAEAWPIPAFNDTGDGAALPVFEYVKESRHFESEAAAAMAAEGAALMPHEGAWCGIARAAAAPRVLSRRTYNATGHMLATNYLGVWECCGGAACGSGAACRRNAVVARGIDLPLEVFRTRGRGWGVRCAVPLRPGQVVATYEGELITNAEAESRRTSASFLYDLDHFHLVLADPLNGAEVQAALPPLPASAAAALEAMAAGAHDLLEAPDAPHLVIDAERRGNVSRFFNHSCSPNMLVQPVLTAGCSGVRYRIAFVAADDVPAGVELCYNYGTRYFFGSGPCACGAVNCTGQLG